MYNTGQALTVVAGILAAAGIGALVGYAIWLILTDG